MFGVSDGRADFVKQLQDERRTVEVERVKEETILNLQTLFRGRRLRSTVRASIVSNIDGLLQEWCDNPDKVSLPKAALTLKAIRDFLIVYDVKQDQQRLVQVCRYTTAAAESADASVSWIAVALGKNNLTIWLRTMKTLATLAIDALDGLPMLTLNQGRTAAVLVRWLLVATSTSTWQILSKSKQLEPMRGSLNTICGNILAHAVEKGLSEKLAHNLRVSLCQSTPAIAQHTLHAALVVAARPLVSGTNDQSALGNFVRHILTVPALVHRMQTIAPNSMALLATNDIFARSLDFLSETKVQQEFGNSFNAASALCLLANLIHLADLNKTLLVEQLLDFTTVVTWLLRICSGDKSKKSSQASQWNAVLGWSSVKIDSCMQQSQPLITSQLGRLWSRQMVECLFRQLVTCAEAQQQSIKSVDQSIKSIDIPSTSAARSGMEGATDITNNVKALLRKLMDKPPSFLQSSTSRTRYGHLGGAETTLIALVCTLYKSALVTFTQLSTDILMGLCRDDFLLPRLWRFITSVGEQNGLLAFLEMLRDNRSASNAEFEILALFADTNATLLTILDEREVFEEQRPFSLAQLGDIAQFANQFVVRSMWHGLIEPSNPLFTSMLNLTLVLYTLDCRRRFTPADNSQVWLASAASSVKPSTLMTDYSKSSQRAIALMSNVPHCVPHKLRVQLFRQCVRNDKVALGHASHDATEDYDIDHHYAAPLLTIHRTNMLEDGYRQMGAWSTHQLKGTIRIKFINEQGLEEAGIDQHGVFKEFLEDIIKRVFDPSLSLFIATSEGRLYPSPLSLVQDNHLALFEFVGRLLGKAVYEGLVVEVPFAHFFLANMLGRRINAFDELTSLDPELYKNLTYVKHFDGDVSSLDLTFSYDEDCMGEIRTHDLVPGGRTIVVTDENKISYIHRLSSFRLVDQIAQQVRAFTTGFRSVVSPAWLSLFAPNELQMLISGASEDIDLADLRQHTHYYGGFHNSHRVVKWLWDVLDRDFDAKERQLFLKFVTSCSKAPLLGFEYLEPSFSIRCVEVADEHDSGDTIGSIVRGFLSMNRKGLPGHSNDRLPTSSTCFNLLKLPNYNRRSVLREKLRYAIHSGTGFELS